MHGARHRRLHRRFHATSCSSAAPRASSRSMSARISSTGGSARIRASSCLEGVNARYLDAGGPAGRSPPVRPRHDRRLVHLAAARSCRSSPPLLGTRRPRHRARQAAVRSRPRGCRHGRHRARRRASTPASSRKWPTAALQVGLDRLAVEPSPVTGAEGNREFLLLLAPVPDAASQPVTPIAKPGSSPD